MVQIHIDIQTRVLDPAHRVFIVRPGANYRLYEDFQRESAILYEVPGLELPLGTPFSEAPDITAQVQRARTIRRWYRTGRGAGLPPPTRDIAEYPYPEASADKRSLSQLFSIGQAYFERARKGDMVIVPPLKFSEDVLVGEITSDVRFDTSVPAYGDETIYGRKVRWLARIPKNNVPSRVIEISQKPNSFVQLERSTALWFYDRAYKSYLLDGSFQSEFKVTSTEFGSTDDAKLVGFLNFVAANYAALSTAGPSLDMAQAMFANLGEFEPEKRISINSPGEFIVHALKLTPLLFLSLMAMTSACSPAELVQAATDGLITIGNSAAAADDQCTAEVYQTTLSWLTLVGADDLLKACTIVKQAINSAGIEIPATVILTP